MFHFIYKTESESGKYDIGRHSTQNIDDEYFGSGKWIRSIKDKSKLKRTILEYCQDFESLVQKEQIYLKEHINNEYCMNFNNNSFVFATGELNPAKNPEVRRKRSLKITGENNPAKRLEVRMKMSESQKKNRRKGYIMSEQGKRNIAAGKIGLKFSDKGRKKLSESRKKQYDNGERMPPSFAGRKHSPETIERMKLAAKNRWNKNSV